MCFTLKQHSAITLTCARCFASEPSHGISAWLPEVGISLHRYITDISCLGPLHGEVLGQCVFPSREEGWYLCQMAGER